MNAPRIKYLPVGCHACQQGWYGFSAVLSGRSVFGGKLSYATLGWRPRAILTELGWVRRLADAGRLLATKAEPGAGASGIGELEAPAHAWWT